MKYFYIACVKERNGKRYAMVVTVTQSNNLVSWLYDSGIIAANICETKKHAYQLMKTWNRQFKEQGCYWES